MRSTAHRPNVPKLPETLLSFLQTIFISASPRPRHHHRPRTTTAVRTPTCERSLARQPGPGLPPYRACRYDVARPTTKFRSVALIHPINVIMHPVPTYRARRGQRRCKFAIYRFTLPATAATLLDFRMNREANLEIDVLQAANARPASISTWRPTIPSAIAARRRPVSPPTKHLLESVQFLAILFSILPPTIISPSSVQPQPLETCQLRLEVSLRSSRGTPPSYL